MLIIYYDLSPNLTTGQRLDGTELYYYNARYYDPLIGRLLINEKPLYPVLSEKLISDYLNIFLYNEYQYLGI